MKTNQNEIHMERKRGGCLSCCFETGQKKKKRKKEKKKKEDAFENVHISKPCWFQHFKLQCRNVVASCTADKACVDETNLVPVVALGVPVVSAMLRRVRKS